MGTQQLDLFGEKEEMAKGAFIDPSGQYRYKLWRDWDKYKQRVTFIMLNPSTADGKADDPTIRRCINFAKAWGYGSLDVVNLFAYRATDPKELLYVKDPIGPDNNLWLGLSASHAAQIVLAWGVNGTLYDRNNDVIRSLSHYGLYCLGTSKDGHPKHPLYIKGNVIPSVFL
jgi:hypothetical protein